MFSGISRYPVFVFLLAALFAVHAFAQDGGVEGDLNTLENYQPPPMFSSGVSPVLTGPVSEMHPAQKSLPPVPPRKPAVAAIKISVPESPASQPPIPPRRPQIIHAPDSFIKRVRSEVIEAVRTPAMPAPVKTVHADTPSAKISNTPYNDLGGVLSEPSVLDILASIDDGMPEPQDNEPPTPTPAAAAEPDDDIISLGFQPGVTALPADIQASLHGQLKKRTESSRIARLEVRAYASAMDQSASSARRVSLARALEIRNFLTRNGVDPALIDIRPLGDNTAGQPIDRVDIFFIEASH